MKHAAILLLLCHLCCTGKINATLHRDTLFVEKKMMLHTSTGDLFGTLMVPDNPMPTVALIVAGSGPTDRNGNGPGYTNNSYKQLAQALATQGIATLRFDKRGIGESASAGVQESDLRFDTYVADVIGWIKLLQADKNFSKLVVIGHSEGALLGLLASKNTLVNGYVSIAGTGEPIDKTLRTQLATQPKDIQDLSYSILDTLQTGKMVTHVDPRLMMLFRPSVQPYMISWMKYDPAKEISELKIPALIIQGTADLQVTVKNAQQLKQADTIATLLLIDHMNHVMKIVSDDPQSNIAAYSNPDLPVPDELVREIIKFIRHLSANQTV